MFQLDEMSKCREHSAIAAFDMCRFGLRIPGTNRFIRKRSTVMTSSRQVFHALNHEFCADQHEHQRLEGNLSINGTSQRLTAFCATYCRSFARMIVKLLCLQIHQQVGPHEQVLVHEDEPPTKKIKTEPNKRRRIQEKISEGHEDSPAPPPVAKSADDAEVDEWQAVLDLADQFAPRVGNVRCSADSELWIRANLGTPLSFVVTDMCLSGHGEIASTLECTSIQHTFSSHDRQ